MAAEGTNGVPALAVRFWGVRGSLPVADAAMRGYGGNTPCVEVRTAAGRLLVLDAGTGIHGLGNRLRIDPREFDADLFLTHFHLDHIQGLHHFAPLRVASTRLRIHGPAQDGVGPGELLGDRLAPVFFPVPVAAFRARIEFAVVCGEEIAVGDARVSSGRMNHPSETRGYRIECGGVAIAYLPDNELGADARPDVDDDAVRLARNADLLIHDAMYTEAEYGYRRGWGHSTFDRAVRIAERAGARALCFFHHSPERSDAELDRLVAAQRAVLVDRGSDLRVAAAREGQRIELRPS